jgi:hypothetical protein
VCRVWHAAVELYVLLNMKRLTKESLILWGGILLLVLSASYFFVPAIPSGRDAGEAATLVEIINTELKGVEKPNNFRILCKPSK